MGNFNRGDKSGPRRDFGRRDFGKRGFGGHGGGREMHKAVCGKCGKDCEVPFEPTDGRPVYCSECFEKKDGGSSAPRNFQDRGPRRPNFERRDEIRPQNNEPFEAINRKLDKILEILSTKPEEITIIDRKKITASKKKPPVTKK
jgi:CxxC-x17-CxxC domain-containing protein